MMHLFINALAASAGGGLTYIRNVVPELAVVHELRVTVALAPGLRKEFGDIPNINLAELASPVARRFWYEQQVLPGLLQDCGADVLLSTGNFALRKSPVPQILLSRNSLYTSVDFYSDLLSRHEYGLWLETRLRSVLAKASIRWADVTVAPSEAFAAELTRLTGRSVVAIHHGFSHETFLGNQSDLPSDVIKSIAVLKGEVKLLFVSHYNYYRNFETLIRALPLLRKRLGERKIKLLLTCRLEKGKNPGSYDPESAARLVRQLGVSDMVTELGEIPYRQLHHLYSSADIYVTPAYSETFAHPLVEAMASGVPVIASDLGVHREICGGAAAYFPRFSPEGLAETVVQVVRSPDISRHMADAGKRRAQDFSWKKHVRQVLQLAYRLTDRSQHSAR